MYFQVGKEEIDSAAEKQNYSNSWDSASLMEEELAKPDALLVCLSSQAKQQPHSTKRYAGAVAILEKYIKDKCQNLLLCDVFK